MRVKIDQNNELNVQEEPQSVSVWWKELCFKVQQENRLIYCAEIDGELLYDGYEDYIVNNFNRINEICIKTLTKQESIVESNISINEYLEGFIPAVIELSDHFYGELTENHWNTFAHFIEGLSWIVKSLEFIELLTDGETDNNNNNTLKELEMIISNLEHALNQKEHVLVGDLIQYELIPLLQNYKSKIYNLGVIQ